jgi:glycosyltransferase involved in cell wall biosynthesis
MEWVRGNATKLKVLHIIDSGGLYGAEIMLLNLVAEQTMLGIEAVIASIGEKGIEEKPIEAEAYQRGLSMRKFRMRPGPNIFGALKILNFARGQGFNILHSHGYKSNILFGLLPRSLRKIPMVSTLHGYTHVVGFSRMRLYEWLDAHSLRFIDAVVLVDQSMRGHPRLKKHNSSNFHVINNGIPLQPAVISDKPSDLAIPPYDHVQKKIIDFCSQGFTIGAIGRLSDEKGFNFLVKSLHILREKGNDVRVIVIGEGGQRTQLEDLAASLKLNDYVLFPGYIPDAKALISHFDIFALPSLTEGLPICLLEAMDAKIPIIASAVGGIPAALSRGKAGLLVKPGNPPSLADGIIKLMTDSKLARQVCANAYHRRKNFYSSRLMAEQYLNAYQEISR